MTTHQKWWMPKGNGIKYSKCWKKQQQKPYVTITLSSKTIWKNGSKIKTFSDK